MNGLSIDCAISRLSIGAKKDEKTVSAIYDIGMKQSETLLPAIDYILQKSELKPCDLDYVSVTTGPGSFTGLRLGLSAAKAISLAKNIPVYAINSLDLYAFPFINFAKENDFIIISEIDAKKERFYAEAFSQNGIFFESGDYTISEIIEKLKSSQIPQKILVTGPESKLFSEELKTALKESADSLKKICVSFLPFENNTIESMFKMTENQIQNKIPPLSDYDGPIYLRKSEAEVKLEEKNGK